MPVRIPILYMVRWPAASLHCKHYLDWFSHFCRVHWCSTHRRTYRLWPTDRPWNCDVCNNRLHLHDEWMNIFNGKSTCDAASNDSVTATREGGRGSCDNLLPKCKCHTRQPNSRGQHLGGQWLPSLNTMIRPCQCLQCAIYFSWLAWNRFANAEITFTGHLRLSMILLQWYCW